MLLKNLTKDFVLIVDNYVIRNNSVNLKGKVQSGVCRINESVWLKTSCSEIPALIRSLKVINSSNKKQAHKADIVNLILECKTSNVKDIISLYANNARNYYIQ